MAMAETHPLPIKQTACGKATEFLKFRLVGRLIIQHSGANLERLPA